MHHPFDGVILTSGETPRDHAQQPEINASPAGRSSRRSFLGALAAGVGGMAGLLAATRDASAQRFTTQALGEEGGRPRYRPYPPAFGGDPPGRRRRDVTTFALGEEGGPNPPAYGGGRVTTQALGEEGGRPPRRRVTTYALGEEGGPRGHPYD